MPPVNGGAPKPNPDAMRKRDTSRAMGILGKVDRAFWASVDTLFLIIVLIGIAAFVWCVGEVIWWSVSGE